MRKFLRDTFAIIRGAGGGDIRVKQGVRHTRVQFMALRVFSGLWNSEDGQIPLGIRRSLRL